jgi:hypothetical protein
MLQGHFYHKTTRKIVSAFGTIFNSITLVKYSGSGAEVERLKVPLSYAQKEKFITSLYQDSTHEKPMQVTLPRMSFEMTGMAYDANRKLPSINRRYSIHPTDKTKVYQNFVPVPYDFYFSLNIYTRNIEDMSQIIEQIIPYFTPDYTVTVSLVDANGQTIKHDIPITMGVITPQIEYEGDGLTPRYVIYSIPFSVKAYIYGPTTNSAIIRKAITNIYDTVGDHEQINCEMANGGMGNFRFEEEVYVGSNWLNASWRGRVLAWSNTSQRLTIYEVTGEKLPTDGDIVFGIDTGARWTITSANRTYLKHAQTVIEPNPNTANVGDANVSYTFTTTEFPNIPS